MRPSTDLIRARSAGHRAAFFDPIGGDGLVFQASGGTALHARPRAMQAEDQTSPQFFQLVRAAWAWSQPKSMLADRQALRPQIARPGVMPRVIRGRGLESSVAVAGRAAAPVSGAVTAHGAAHPRRGRMRAPRPEPFARRPVRARRERLSAIPVASRSRGDGASRSLSWPRPVRSLPSNTSGSSPSICGGALRRPPSWTMS